jgi:hypothetical protein
MFTVVCIIVITIEAVFGIHRSYKINVIDGDSSIIVVSVCEGIGFTSC